MSIPKLGAALGLFLLCVCCGCATDELTGRAPDNRPPTAWMSIGPPEGDTVVYTVRFFWGGWDPDGDVAYFEYSISDNENGVFSPADTVGVDKWHRTNARDSVFAFSADVLADSSVIGSGEMGTFDFVRSHTFFIRAVDDRGARSRAVHRSFTARTLSPLVDVFIPRVTGFNIALVPPVITFRYAAVDFVSTREEVQDPDSTRSILINLQDYNGSYDEGAAYIRNNPDAPEWTPWIAYSAPADSGRSWRPEQPLPFGTYMFAVQAKDEAGAATPVFDPDRNLKRIRVMDRQTGPVLLLENRFLGRVSTSIANPPAEVINVPAGIDLNFSWSADASGYGGTVAGYRYGWDIIDVNDDEEWDVDFTPFVASVASSPTRRFLFGSHTFHLEALDNSGFKSRLTVAVNIVPFTMERDLLLVDDWDEGSSLGFSLTKGAIPTDAEHDRFWRDMLEDVGGFVPDVDTYPQAGRLLSVPIEIIARYKTIIWNARGHQNLETEAVLDRVIQWEGPEVNTLQLFMEAGGRVLVCGEQAMTLVIDKKRFPRTGHFGGQAGPRYPFIYRYELEGDQGAFTEPTGDGSFAYDSFCLNVVDLAYGAAIGRRRSFCPVSSTREFDGQAEGLRACVPVDETYAFPRLELRPEIVGPTKWFREDQLGLNANAFNPLYFADCAKAELDTDRGCFEPMYTFECLDESSGIFGAPVAFWTSRYVDVAGPVPGRSAAWGFSPVYFTPSQVKDALEIILFEEWQLPRRSTALYPASEEGSGGSP